MRCGKRIVLTAKERVNPRRSRHGAFRRATALVLAYVFSLTSAWAAAPPPVPVAAGTGSWVPVSASWEAPPVSDAPVPTSTLTVPTGASTLAAQVADPALDSVTTSLAQGVVVGQVLSDASGLPLPGATVRVVSDQGDVTTTSDERGRYALPASDPLIILRVEKAGMTPVDRTLSVQEGVGSVVVDARLTPGSDPTTITPLGGTLTAGGTSVTIPAGAVSAEAAFTLTALSPQGLPGLLPLGWSPLAAFDLAATASVAGNLEASFTGVPALAMHLVTYRPALHEWVMVAPGLTPADGAITASVPGPGSYALVVPDTTDMSVPAAGQMLAGVDMVPLPQTATATGVVSPATLPPMGGTATGSISVHSPIPLPSGTVVQVQVSETFTLASGSITSGEQRPEDILLFRTPAPSGAALAASFPIAPSRTFAPAELREGKVHLDIFAGRESVRGKTGGSDAVTLESGDARLSVAAGALSENTAIAFEQAGTLSSFLPSSGDLMPLAELVVDFSGKTLSRGAELSVLATGVSAEDTLLVAEVVRVGDVPRVAVVALAQLVGDRVVSQAYPGLPGIVEGGRYVFYRSSPVGFVSGVTSSPAGPVKALVATDSLAFVSYSRLDGSYIVAARPGGVGLTSRVTGTSLVGAGTATVQAAQTSSLNLSLAGAVTGATVSPEDGSVAVPTNVQVEITTSSPMNPSTVSAESIKLFKGPVSDHQAVAVRFVLSASAKTLALIPQAALEPGTSYTLVASGLADAFGGLVQVPTTTFKTKESTLPVYDVRKLTFSFPDQDGLVTVSAPAGTFPPGTTILIINSGNGVVLSLTAENDGAVGKLVPATLPATLDDQMLVTITDPLGHVTTFTRSQFFDAATGKTAVGPGGGVVEAADGSGVELRIPEGALEGGARFRIAPFRLEDLPEEERQTPDFPQAALGGGLKLESEDKPELKKEAKLAFPLPSGLPANPKDAFFYVYRKLQGPDGKVYFQTIDQAFVECPQGNATCTPEQMRVVTASFPFPGLVDAIGSFAEGIVSSVTATYYFLMWTYDQTQPGKALSGTITGRVLRQKWEATAEYEPLRKVTVLGVAPDSTMAALTDDTGRFTLFDPRYAGGTVEVRATVDGVTKTATAYEANPNDWTSTLLRHHPNVATADIVFPAVPPAGPPASIQIVVVREADRAPIAGFAQVGTPLLIGFKTETTISDGAVIQGATLPVQGPLTDDPSGFNYAGSFTPSQAGTHTVTVTGVAASGQAITASSSFLAVAAGGSNNEPLPNEAPRVLTDLTLPQPGARDVPVTVFPQVVFSEPVRGLTTGVTLTSLDGSGNPVKTAPVSLLGITTTGQVVEITDDGATVTSLTVRPAAGLAYATPYKLSLKATITDLDAPPKALEAYDASFTTFGPKSVGGSSDRPLSPGIALLGDRAYLVENLFYGGTLKAYDVSNPVEVKELESARKPIVNHPMDVTGELDGPLARRIVAVATASTNRARPSNLHLFDTSDDGASQWIGAVSLTPSAVAGSVRRIAVKGSFAYAITFRKGIQAVDLELARSLFVPCGTGSTCSLAHWEMLEALSKDGQGFGGAAVIRTTPVRNPQASRDAYLWDLEVRDFVTDPSAGPKPLVVATGDVPLVVADAQAGQVLSQGGIEKTDASGKTSKLSYGHALGLGYAGLRTLGVVGGLGTVAGASAKTMVAVVGLDDPRRPVPLGFLDLSDQTCLAQSAGAMLADVLVKDDQALIGGESCVAVVNLADPTKPMFAGTIGGAGGRLALGEGNILFSTARSVFAGSADLGGVRSAALGNMTYIKSAPPVVVAADGKSIEPQPIQYRALFPREQVETSEVEITDGGAVVQRLAASLDANGSGEVSVPAGTKHSPLKARLVINRDKPSTQRPSFVAERLLRAASFEVEPGGEAEVKLEADADPLVITAVNGALQERLAESRTTGKKVEPPALSWLVVGDAGATVEPPAETLSDTGDTGLYSSSFLPSGKAGSLHRVELRLGSTVLGRSAPIRVVPGQACQGQVEWSTAEVPADGASKKSVRISAVKDCFENAVPDGRPVTWEVLAQAPIIGPPGVESSYALMPGAFKSATTYIKNGETTNEYIAGVEPGWVRFGAHVDDNLTKEFMLRQAPLTAQMTLGIVSEQQRVFALDVDSQAGRSPDGTPVGWGLTAGILDAQKTLTGSTANALFTWPLDPKVMTIGVPYVFATVGRKRADMDAQILSAVPPSPGLFIELLGRYLLGDRSDGSRFDVPDGQGGVTFSVPSEIIVRVGGGSPGQQVPLSLDSYRIPAYLPVNHYSFDSVVEASGVSTTSDLFGASPAAVGSGISVDGAEVAEGAASLRFSLDGDAQTRGLSVSADKAFSPGARFGISGYVRLDSAAEQTIVSKQGAYEISVVLVDGQPYLEFAVVNGGIRRGVLASEPLVAGTWYHFAGRLESGYLQLLLGDAGVVKVGDSASAPDVTATPLRIGPSFAGNLDELAFFDFLGTPIVVFEDGGTSTNLTLNDQGEGQVRFWSTGAYQGAPLGVLAHYGANFVRIQEPPLLPRDWVMSWINFDQALQQRYGTYITSFLNQCLGGIADGESGGGVGAACDLLLGIGSLFTPAGPVVNLGQSGRDTVVSTKNFIEGKDRSTSVIKGSLGMLGVIGSVGNPLGRVAKLSQRAHAIVEGFEAADRLVLREALETIARKLGNEEAAVPRLLEVLGDETGRVAPRTKQALLEILSKSSDVAETAAALERLGNIYEYEKLVASLDNALQEIASNSTLGSTLKQGLGGRLVGTLDELARTAELAGVVPKLGNEAIKGAAVFLAHGIERGWKRNRVLRIWIDIGKSNPAKQVSVFDDMMRWVAEGERANIPGWVAFLAKGPGTLSPQSTRGAYAVLEYLSTRMQWKNIVELERGVGRCIFVPFLGKCVNQRYIDIVAKEADAAGNVREVYKEIKNLKEGAAFGFSSEVKFDVGEVLKVTARDARGRLVVDDLISRLAKLEYVLRGTPEQMADVVAGLTKKIKTVLSAAGPEYEQYAAKVKITPLSQPLPF